MLRREWIASPNYSSRGGSGVRLVVVHTAEGARTYRELGNFFASSSSGVSSHTGIDDTPGVIGEYVSVDLKAWTAAAANPYAVQTELCAFAAWDYPTWCGHPALVENCAAWIAEECGRFGIPLRRLSAAEAQGGAAGVCGHVDLGPDGGNHWDPGPGFPWDDVMEMAGGGRPNVPDATSRKGRNMICATESGNGYWTVTSDGAVGAFGDAEYHGGGFSPDVISGEVIGIAGVGNSGYWLMASDGGIFAFGSAQFYGRPDRA
jgi:hypothetical protein